MSKSILTTIKESVEGLRKGELVSDDAARKLGAKKPTQKTESANVLKSTKRKLENYTKTID